MLNIKEKATEQKVLEIYMKENPSTYRIEDDENLYKKLREYGSRLYIPSLKILPQVFDGSDLLEFGSGTGERSMNFLRWGANCTFVEMNDDAVKRAKYLFRRYYPDSTYKFVVNSLFDFESDEKYDITISNAVIHHTPDKKKAFKKTVSYLKKGGINVLGIGSTGACIQRNLQRFIVYSFAGRDVESIEKVAEDLFTEHLDRAEKFGGRSRKAIIYDTYVNPKMDFISVKELMEWYKEFGLKHYSSWPPIVPSILANDLGGKTDWRNFPELLSQPEWIWGTQITEDSDLAEILEEKVKPFTSGFRQLAESLNDVEAENLHPGEVFEFAKSISATLDSKEPYDLKSIRSFDQWLDEIARIMKALKEDDYTTAKRIIKNSQLLFRGKGGIGLNYFAAIKE